MSHDHGHHATNRTRRAIAFAITVAVLLAEIVGAVLTGSLALLVGPDEVRSDSK